MKGYIYDWTFGTDEVLNIKKEDEIYWTESGKVIKRNTAICPYRGIQVKVVKYEPVKNTEVFVSQKSRKVAVWPVFFLGIWL